MLETVRISPDTPLWTAFVNALTEDTLPTRDLESEGQSFFAFKPKAGTAAGKVVGFGGITLAGADALIRSVVVLGAHRGNGYGLGITEALVREAQKAQIQHAWLLTTKAAGLFGRAGFRPRERSDAPRLIAAAPEFAGLCPASAIFMSRDLDL